MEFLFLNTGMPCFAFVRVALIQLKSFQSSALGLFEGSRPNVYVVWIFAIKRSHTQSALNFTTVEELNYLRKQESVFPFNLSSSGFLFGL